MDRDALTFRSTPRLALLFTAAGFAAGLLAAALCLPLRPPPASAQSVPVGNGDVNGDGSLDLSDPVYTLTHLFLAGPPPVAIECSWRPLSTALVVRHAERETGGSDPCLTAEGRARADHLRDILARARVDAVYATNYCRAEETVRPAAAERVLTVERLAGVAEIAAAARSLPAGNTVLVAGNSFNIGDILSGFGVSEPVSVPSSEYDNLWVVQFDREGKRESVLTRLRY